MHLKICLKCGVVARIEKTGATLLEKINGVPHALWSFDLYRCPECEAPIAGGFGGEALSTWHQDNCERQVAGNRIISGEHFFEVEVG